MNKENDFEEYFHTKYGEAMQWRDWQTCDQLAFAKSHMKDTWDHQQNIINDLIEENKELIELYQDLGAQPDNKEVINKLKKLIDSQTDIPEEFEKVFQENIEDFLA